MVVGAILVVYGIGRRLLQHLTFWGRVGEAGRQPLITYTPTRISLEVVHFRPDGLLTVASFPHV